MLVSRFVKNLNLNYHIDSEINGKTGSVTIHTKDKKIFDMLSSIEIEVCNGFEVVNGNTMAAHRPVKALLIIDDNTLRMPRDSVYATRINAIDQKLLHYFTDHSMINN